MGSAHPVAAPYQAFPTADGWLNIGAMSQATWVGTAEVLGLPWMVTDERFATNAARMKYRAELVELISNVLRTRPTDDWVGAFERAGVPAGPVKNMQQVLDDPQTRAREMVIRVDHPVAGEIDALGLPIKFSHGNGVTRRGAPLYGQHTAEVMAELGYARDEIDRLAEAGVVHLDAASLAA
jgi:crotonobetainyl-CoA:carnitine CoA-transferase CaiB-like acyl-CoA transferase